MVVADIQNDVHIGHHSLCARAFPQDESSVLSVHGLPIMGCRTWIAIHGLPYGLPFTVCHTYDTLVAIHDLDTWAAMGCHTRAAIYG